MKKVLFAVSLLLTGSIIIASGAYAQTDEFTLEEITVTSEKREVNIQEIPSSVVAISGVNLMEQGKITTEQMLENIPNVVYGEGLESNPDGGIAIRGIKYKRTSDGQPPSATATYVDGIFQGIGGDYDIDRVEILRGPQGTLYGRSATGGVVAFHTKNPVLSEYDASVSAELGTADLRNVQAVFNAPLGDVLALRVAGRFYDRDGYFNPDGAYRKSKEGRAKLLYQPTDKFQILLNASIADTFENSGGITAKLKSPTEIDYDASVSDVSVGGVIRSTQTALQADYDFGGSTLTYIGAYRTYKDVDSPGFRMNPPGGNILLAMRKDPGEHFYTQEMRLASDSEERLTWLVGANYYKGDYDRFERTIQEYCTTGDPNVVDPNDWENVLIFEQIVNGWTQNYGFFTEETYDIRDDLHLTVGLRYDSTTVNAFEGFNFNMNIDEYGNSIQPEDVVPFGLSDKKDWHNITYKIRLDYDLTPDNMLYGLIATGFQPGDVKLGNVMTFGPSGIEDVTFVPLPFDEEKLTSFEVGSKNRFMEDRMQVNLSAFYYDYHNYNFFIDTALYPGPPSQAQVPTDLTMFGLELASDLLITMNDRVSFNFGWLDAKIDKYRYIEGLGDTQQFMVLRDITGIPDLTATAAYEHTFNLINGSLVPRVEVNYIDGYYITNMNYVQRDLGLAPYAYQDGYSITNLSATWTSSDNTYSVTGYVRNAFDQEYKKGVTLSKTSLSENTVTPGDRRAWGLVFRTNF